MMGAAMKRILALVVTLCLVLGAASADEKYLPEKLMKILNEQSAASQPAQTAPEFPSSVFTLDGCLFEMDRGNTPLKKDGSVWAEYRLLDAETGEQLFGNFNAAVSGDKCAYGICEVRDDTTHEFLGNRVYEFTADHGKKAVNARQIALVKSEGENTNVQCAATDGKNVVVVIDDYLTFSGNPVYRVDIATGKVNLLQRASTIRSLAFDGEGYIALCDDFGDYDNKIPPYLARMDMETGKTEKALDLPNSMQSGGLTWDETSGYLYAAVGESIYRTTAKLDKYEACGDAPVQMNYLANASACVYSMAYVITSSSADSVYFVSTSPEDMASARIRVFGNAYDFTDIYAGYTSLNPNVSFEFKSGDIGDAEKFRQNMQGKKAPDIYILSTASDTTTAIIKKGYCEDLSSSKIIADFSANVYPTFSALSAADGKIKAVPLGAECVTLAYYKDALEELGLTDDEMPRTYMELLEFTERYVNEILPEYPQKYLLDWGNNVVSSTFFDFIFKSQIAYCRKNNIPLTLDTPEMHQLLEKISSMKPTWDILASTDNSNAGSASYDENGAHHCSIFAGYCDIAPVSNFGTDEGSVMMPLTIYPDESPCFSANVTYLLVNPYSKNKDAAIRFVEYLVTNLPQGNRNTVLVNENVSLENEYYTEQKAHYDAVMPKLLAGMEEAPEDEKELWQEEIDRMDGNLRFYAISRWNISPEVLERYNAAVPNMVIMPPDSYGNREGDANKLRQRFLDGQMDASSFIKEYSRIVQMMEQELS